jgi:hypothetical protein
MKKGRFVVSHICGLLLKCSGSLAIWLGQIFHGAGPNVCDPGDPDALRIIYGLFACVSNALFAIGAI